MPCSPVVSAIQGLDFHYAHLKNSCSSVVPNIRGNQSYAGLLKTVHVHCTVALIDTLSMIDIICNYPLPQSAFSLGAHH